MYAGYCSKRVRSIHQKPMPFSTMRQASGRDLAEAVEGRAKARDGARRRDATMVVVWPSPRADQALVPLPDDVAHRDVENFRQRHENKKRRIRFAPFDRREVVRVHAGVEGE